MRKNCFVLLFVVLAMGVYSPSAKALGYVDVLYAVTLDTTFFGSSANKVAAPMNGSMVIRYNNGTGITGSGTTIAAGDARLMRLNVSGPVVLFVGGVLSMTGTAWLDIETAHQIGTWGPSIPFSNAGYTSITKTSGLFLPGLKGLMTADVHCFNIGGTAMTGGVACTGIAGMPTGTTHTLPIPFVGKNIKGYGNFNATGPPNTLSFLHIVTTGTTATIPMSHNLAASLINLPVPMSMYHIVGFEVNRTFVPEPSTALLLGGGIIGLAAFGSALRRRKS